MFSYLFTPTPEPAKTRLESTPQLQELVPLLDALHKKEVALKTAVNDNAAHPNFLKSEALSRLVQQMDNVTEQFNAMAKPQNHDLEMLSIALLTLKLGKLVEHTANTKKEALDVKASAAKSYSKTVVEVGSMVGTGLAGFVTLGPVGGAVAFFCGGPRVSDKMLEVTGLDDDRSNTLRQIQMLASKLSQIYKALESLLAEAPFDVKLDVILPVVCPISREPVKDPVIWMASGRTLIHEILLVKGRIYERSAVAAWFEEHQPELAEQYKRNVKNLTLNNFISSKVTIGDVLAEYNRMLVDFAARKAWEHEVNKKETVEEDKDDGLERRHSPSPSV